MAKPTYSLIYKKNIIRALLGEVQETKKEYMKTPEYFSQEFWAWNQSQISMLITVLDILDDNLSYMTKDIINNAEEMTTRAVNKMAGSND